VQRLAVNPFQFPIVAVDIRRTLLRGFPYSLFFRLVGDDVFVIACFHSSRDPQVWRGRT
jgi:hypothetical protein